MSSRASHLFYAVIRFVCIRLLAQSNTFPARAERWERLFGQFFWVHFQQVQRGALSACFREEPGVQIGRGHDLICDLPLEIFYCQE